MTPANVVFFGYGELGIAALTVLQEAGARITAVVAPGNRTGVDVDVVRTFAASHDLPVWIQPPRREVRPFVQRLKAAAPDVILVWSYSMMLPQAVLDVPRLGAVNVHGGLLPKYRGGHVMQWAIVHGESETGVTLHYLEAGMDTGPIIAETRFAIDDDDDAWRVREHLKLSGAALLRQWWPKIADGTAPRAPQDETRARYYRLRVIDDGLIDWSASNDAVRNLVRALVAPWPGAFTFVGNTRLIVRKVEQVAAARVDAAAGTVTHCVDDDVRVATGSGVVRLLSIEIDGRPASTDDLRRAGMAAGVRLSSTPL